MREPLDLQATQTLFWQLIMAPKGVAAGAAELRARGTLESESLEFFVRGDERLGAAARLDVYANMYFYRLRDCLAEDFPKLAAHIGSDHFHNLVTDYLLRHPSRHPSLRELGRALPRFLALHPVGDLFSAAPDLAVLEWARVDVFDEIDAVALGVAELLNCGEAALRGIPALRLISIDPRALQIWRDGGSSETADPVWVLVWRRDLEVHHRSIEADEAECLQQLAGSGADLAELGEQIAAARPEGEAAERLAQLLGRWAANRILMLDGDRPVQPPR